MANTRNGQDRSLQNILWVDINIKMVGRAGCPHPAAEKRKYLPQTDKLFVGDDACIVPHDGQRKYILPKSKDVCLFGGQGALRPQARFGGQPDRRSGS